MSTIVRWQPWHETKNLLEEFDRMLARPTRRPQSSFGIALDVIENEDGYIVHATVPGMNPEQIETTMEDNILLIKGEIGSEEAEEGSRYHVRERRYGSFSRQVRFPLVVDAERVEAVYEQGVLTLTVPKAEIVKPKRITITAS